MGGGGGATFACYTGDLQITRGASVCALARSWALKSADHAEKGAGRGKGRGGPAVRNATHVLVDIVEHLVGTHDVVAVLRDGDEARLDLKVPCKLLQRDLSLGAHDDVRARVVDVLARLLHLLLPPALHRHAAQHDGLGRTGRRCAHRRRVLGVVPQARDHVL